jgi:hypothetical protein
MPTGQGRAERVFATCAAAVAWFGLGLQLYVTLATAAGRERSLLISAGEYSSYFTILTNLLVAVALSVRGQQVPWGRFFARPTVLAGLAVAIALVAVAYNLLRWHPEGLGRIADETLHVVMPLPYLVFWGFYAPKALCAGLTFSAGLCTRSATFSMRSSSARSRASTRTTSSTSGRKVTEPSFCTWPCSPWRFWRSAASSSLSTGHWGRVVRRK